MQLQLNSKVHELKCMLTRQVRKLMCKNIIYDPPKKCISAWTQINAMHVDQTSA